MLRRALRAANAAPRRLRRGRHAPGLSARGFDLIVAPADPFSTFATGGPAPGSRRCRAAAHALRPIRPGRALPAPAKTRVFHAAESDTPPVSSSFTNRGFRSECAISGMQDIGTGIGCRRGRRGCSKRPSSRAPGIRSGIRISSSRAASSRRRFEETLTSGLSERRPSPDRRGAEAGSFRARVPLGKRKRRDADGPATPDRLGRPPEWLDTAADVVQPGVKGFFGLLGSARAAIKDFLHGTWLGHPLHPVLTDVAAGSLDGDASSRRSREQGRSAERGSSSSRRCERRPRSGGSRRIGRHGLDGLEQTDARPRRLGMAHAALNSGATLLFGASLSARFGANRRLGRELAVGRLPRLIAAAYLGGDLVYHEQIGVDHSSGKPMPEKFTRVLSAEDLAEGTLKRVRFHQTPILLVRRGSACSRSRRRAPIWVGRCRKESSRQDRHVSVAWLALRPGVRRGRRRTVRFPQPCLEARIRQGQIEIRTGVRPAD